MSAKASLTSSVASDMDAVASCSATAEIIAGGSAAVLGCASKVTARVHVFGAILQYRFKLGEYVLFNHLKHRVLEVFIGRAEPEYLLDNGFVYPESILKAQQQIHVTVTELNDVDERINLLQSMQPGPAPHADIVRVDRRLTRPNVTASEVNDVNERINLLKSMQPGPGPHADIVRISKKRSKRLVVDSADVDDKIEDLEKMLT